MLVCPNCKCVRSTVLDSRNRASTEGLYRRRKCQKCNAVFKTQEVILVEKPKPKPKPKPKSNVIKGRFKYHRKKPVEKILPEKIDNLTDEELEKLIFEEGTVFDDDEI